MSVPTVSNGQQNTRLSALDAERKDLHGGPNVAMPPKHLMDYHVEKDGPKNRLGSDVSSAEDSTNASPATTPLAPAAVSATPEFALAFDIDGVLLRGGKPIPEAAEAMKYINGENPYGVQV